MITITVSSYNGTALAQPIVAQFDELGGNIGRAENNQLVLPDPERTISRVHAQVVFRSGRYGIVDRGSNPISVNGRPLGNGQESPLQSGDEVQIGGYALRISAGGGSQAAADPFADFGGLAAAPPPSRGGAATAAGAFADPLAAFGMAPSAPPPPSRAPAMGFGAPPPPPASASGIPDDWDPFAPDAASKAAGNDFARSLGQGGPGGGANFGLDVGARGPAPLIPDFGGASGGGGDSLDNLFGLGPGGTGADPLANSVLARPDALPNMAANADPMKSLNSIGRGTATAAADLTPELNTPFTLPTASSARTAPPPTPIPPSPPPAVRVAGGGLPPPTKGAVLSWDEGRNEGQTIIRPKGTPTARPAAPPAPALAPMAAPASATLPADIDFLFDAPLGAPKADPFAAAPAPALLPDDPFGEPLVAPPPPAPPAPPAAAAIPKPPVAAPAPPRTTPVAAATAPADQAALIDALREGLRTPALPIESLTPELMKLLGQLVHEATRGTVDLLVARAALKREIRAEVTMIVAKENNPLKFSPSVDVALNHLLSPPARGFMPPDRAMRDAYDDLRAHQFGFLAGLRAALEGVLKRFDPATLEGKLTQKKSMLATLLPAGRKAKLWDVFQEMYGQISTEAEDDFHELFGKEFLKAYEAYIERLDQERP